MEEILIVGICLALNALLAAFEMAFVSVPKSDLRSLVRAGDKRAKVLLELRENPERTLSIVQIGITLVGAVAAAIGGAGASDTLEPYFVQTLGLTAIEAEILAVILVVVPLTYLSVVVGELLPKSLALRTPKKIVLAGARTLFVADRILSPVVTFLEASTKTLLYLFFRRQRSEVQLSQHSVEIDALSPLHQKFVINMANIETMRVKDTMVDWETINLVSDTDPMQEVTRVVLESGHTRLPVMHGPKIAGILHTKEFMALRESGESNWLSIIRPPFIVKPTDSSIAILRNLQERRNHMAIVAGPSGEPLGIITLEDIIENVVGDIYDEDDDGRIRKLMASRARDKKIQSTPRN